MLVTREPGGTPGAELIRQLLVEGPPDRWLPLTEALLLQAARHDHVVRRIAPALAAGPLGAVRSLHGLDAGISGRGGRRRRGGDRSPARHRLWGPASGPDGDPGCSCGHGPWPPARGVRRAALRADDRRLPRARARRLPRACARRAGAVRPGSTRRGRSRRWPPTCATWWGVASGSTWRRRADHERRRAGASGKPRAVWSGCGPRRARSGAGVGPAGARLAAHGPPGIGKATLAFRFARALLAGPDAVDDRLSMPPDHPVFRQVAQGTHPDLR